ncbi:unnamed protein product [Prorocentrum cordatum]|uniref:Uncharacterized protein n=1 Tax=Prorocentrum cordatum TaxID=2364126 RepID=A0ABN9TTH3_9DINO|nr:unnamed protein product [Polarella glacialis]
MTLAPAGSAGREFWSRSLPGELYLAWYEDDTFTYHERMSLWPTIVRDERDLEYVENVRGCVDGPFRARGLRNGRLPSGVAHAVYRFREHPGIVEYHISPSGRERLMDPLIDTWALRCWRRPWTRGGRRGRCAYCDSGGLDAATATVPPPAGTEWTVVSPSVGWARIGDVFALEADDLTLAASGLFEGAKRNGIRRAQVQATSAAEWAQLRAIVGGDMSGGPLLLFPPVAPPSDEVGESDASAGTGTLRAVGGLSEPIAPLNGPTLDSSGGGKGSGDKDNVRTMARGDQLACGVLIWAILPMLGELYPEKICPVPLLETVSLIDNVRDARCADPIGEARARDLLERPTSRSVFFHGRTAREDLAQFFSLPPLAASAAGLEGRVGLRVASHDVVWWPCCAAFPTGFGWGLVVAQTANQDQCAASFAGACDSRQDGGLAMRDRMEKAPRPATESFGVELDAATGGRAPAAARDWRLGARLRRGLARRKASAYLIEVFVGLYASVGLFATQTISVFHAAHKFAQPHPVGLALLWPSARTDFRRTPPCVRSHLGWGTLGPVLAARFQPGRSRRRQWMVMRGTAPPERSPSWAARQCALTAALPLPTLAGPASEAAAGERCSVFPASDAGASLNSRLRSTAVKPPAGLGEFAEAEGLGPRESGGSIDVETSDQKRVAPSRTRQLEKGPTSTLVGVFQLPRLRPHGQPLWGLDYPRELRLLIRKVRSQHLYLPTLHAIFQELLRVRRGSVKQIIDYTSVVNPTGSKRECTGVDADKRRLKVKYDDKSSRDEWLPRDSKRIVANRDPAKRKDASDDNPRFLRKSS